MSALAIHPAVSAELDTLLEEAVANCAWARNRARILELANLLALGARFESHPS